MLNPLLIHARPLSDQRSAPVVSLSDPSE